MAKYDVTYSCGHEGVVSLFGKGAGRERQLVRYRRRVCPDCYRKQLDEENRKAGVKLVLTFNRFNDSVMVIASGDTYNHKEELKKLGFIFGQVDLGDFSPYGDYPKMWGIYLDCFSDEELEEKYAALVASVREGVTTHVTEVPVNADERRIISSLLKKAAEDRRQAEEKRKEEEAACEERARQEAKRRGQEKRDRWKRIAIPAECARNIGGISGNILVKFPAESRLAGYSFLVSPYSVFQGRHDGELYLGLHKNFNREAAKLKRLWKKNKAGRRYEFVNPVAINRNDVIECFGNEVEENAPKTERAYLTYDAREETITHVPEPMEPVQGVEPDDELLREEDEQ